LRHLSNSSRALKAKIRCKSSEQN